MTTTPVRSKAGSTWAPTPGVRAALFVVAAALIITVITAIVGTGAGGAHQHGVGLPAPTVARFLTPIWEPWFAIPLFAATALYLAGVVRLQQRGIHWPVGRTACWLVGAAVVWLTTQTGFSDYAAASFSVHMVQHMTLSMVAPIPLLLAAPITLALRAISPAQRGRTGFREVILLVVHSRVARVFAHPVFGAALFMVSVYGLYFTGIFEDLMRSPAGHRMMLFHFITVGFIFFWPLISPDPTPYRVSYPVRFLVLVASMPLHAFAGLVMMQQSTPIAASYYESLHRTWWTDLMADQRWAGGFTWAFGELPTLVLVLVIAAQWARSDERAARRSDRLVEQHPERDPLTAYNDYLEKLANNSR